MPYVLRNSHARKSWNMKGRYISIESQTHPRQQTKARARLISLARPLVRFMCARFAILPGASLASIHTLSQRKQELCAIIEWNGARQLFISHAPVALALGEQTRFLVLAANLPRLGSSFPANIKQTAAAASETSLLPGAAQRPLTSHLIHF